MQKADKLLCLRAFCEGGAMSLQRPRAGVANTLYFRNFIFLKYLVICDHTKLELRNNFKNPGFSKRQEKINLFIFLCNVYLYFLYFAMNGSYERYNKENGERMKKK